MIPCEPGDVCRHPPPQPPPPPPPPPDPDPDPIPDPNPGCVGCSLPASYQNTDYYQLIADFLPDYGTLNFAIPVLAAFPVFGVDLQLTVDYYGQWYVAGGAFLGAPGVSVFAGDLLQLERPTPEQLESFITQDSISLGGGNGIVGGGGTWGNFINNDELGWNDFAVEAGWSSPGVLGAWTYGITLENLINSITNFVTGNP